MHIAASVGLMSVNLHYYIPCIESTKPLLRTLIVSIIMDIASQQNVGAFISIDFA